MMSTSLFDVATGKTPHLYAGRCPDSVNGPEPRDPDCPACQAIAAAEAREMRDEYRSASCDDVARRVDECMTLRAERDALAALVSDLDESSSYWSEYEVPLGIVERIKEAAKTWKGRKQ